MNWSVSHKKLRFKRIKCEEEVLSISVLTRAGFFSSIFQRVSEIILWFPHKNFSVKWSLRIWRNSSQKLEHHIQGVFLKGEMVILYFQSKSKIIDFSENIVNRESLSKKDILWCYISLSFGSFSVGETSFIQITLCHVF